MDKKRLNASEQNALLSLCAAYNAIGDARGLDRRFAQIPRGKQMIGSVDGQIAKLIEQVAISMPEDQLKAFYRNRNTLTYFVSVRSPNGRRYDDDGRWLSYGSLDILCKAASTECITCMKDPQEQRKCLLAKALDELPCTKADEEAFGCRYFKGLY